MKAGQTNNNSFTHNSHNAYQAEKNKHMPPCGSCFIKWWNTKFAINTNFTINMMDSLNKLTLLSNSTI